MKTESEVKIEKMVLNIEGEKVSLSMEQAKKLKKILDELFGKEVIKEVVEKHHYHDWYYRPYKFNEYWGTSTGKGGMLGDIVYCSDNAQLSVNL